MKPLIVFSRHPSHDALRKAKLEFKERVCIRLGSDTTGKLKYKVEINSPEVAKISGDKLLMKQKFMEAGVKTADWWTIENDTMFWLNKEGNVCQDKINFSYPIIAKYRWGSRGTGNVKLDNAEELENFINGKEDKLANYIFEAFFKHGREYRLHVTKDGCFYTCRKMLKKDAKETWHRHDENCVWIKEENPLFDKPINWDAIVADCIKALETIEADVLAFDVKVENAKDKNGHNRKNPEWILIESCSAPSFGETTLQKYIEIIPKIVEKKLNENNKT